MKQDRLQLQRFELKYIIREELAQAARNFVSSYLTLDEFGATQPNLSYSVHSLYLDTDQLALYWHTIGGNKNRFKMRIRFYDNSPDAPVYLEIKRRTDNTISKQRGPILREAVGCILAGQMPDPAHVPSESPEHLRAIQNFVRLVAEHGFAPRAHVSYLREAWLSQCDNSVRVTMDRNVLTQPDLTARLSPEMTQPTRVFGDKVVLELKFTGRFPDWFGEMVRIFGLTRCSAAKYVDGVALVGENRFSGFPARFGIPEEKERLLARKDSLEKRCGPDIFLSRGFA